MAAATIPLDLMARDATGAKKIRIPSLTGEMTVRELTHAVLRRMGLKSEDAEGRPIDYQVRLEREGRHLHDSELVGDALQRDDQVVVLPRIHAG